MDNMEPVYMPYKLLREITDGFSEKQIVGRGTFGVVYKGEDKDARVIAVKILKFFEVSDDDFHREFNNLAKLRHENIVQLLGFCNETENAVLEHNGKQVCAEIVHRALCFEYMPNGSLHYHLYDVGHGFDWNKRYIIIKGICEGLKYLHTESRPVYHLDLKPENILLDHNMLPKIADFGLSRLLGDENISAVGTSGYMPPEYLNYQTISKEFDIFSLGVIVIKIMMGSAGYSHIVDMEPNKFIEHVCNKWRKRLQAIGWQYIFLTRQVKKCIEIALKCIETDKSCRPTIEFILEQLNATERHTNDSPSRMEESDDSESMAPKSNNPGGRYQGDKKLDPLNTLPERLSLEFLKHITNGFSSERKLGEGAFGTVYKGILQGGQPIAVKKLADNAPINPENQFKIGVGSVMAMQHLNIVRLLGYCCEPQKKVIEYNGRYIVVDAVERLLYYEYVPNGNLDKYISDASFRPDWKTCFKIIKGICQGLHYIHKEMDMPIVHLDLQPTNILLDENMVPKINDFGVSRFIGDEQSGINTLNVVGRKGYMAPEYLYRGSISTWSDIYSLGVVIMEITTGERNISSEKDMAARDFIDKVRVTWTDEYIAAKHTSLDAGSMHEVRTCIEIGLKCVDIDKNRRPSIVEIVDKLNGRQTLDRINMASKGKTTMELNILERVVAGNEEPTNVDLSLLQSITGNFSEQKKIGVGGCGEVYKGILGNGIVAVKRLYKNRTIKSKMFHREIQSLITVRHENIVRLLGYCSVTEERVVTLLDGGTILADIRERLLCFEYISNGNLENHLTDELRGLEWHIRYEIIVGICNGLLYLHKEKDIIHMDLKPANILLDDRMAPKITDFGLSRFDNNSQTKTNSRLISLGYCAPEYLLKGKSSSKSDIYSLGVIITELVTGTRNEPDLTKVLKRWRHRWIKSSEHTPLGYKQVTKCLRLAQRCMQNDPTNRPDIVDITQELDAFDSKDDQFQAMIPPLEDMLGIEPLEIHFPFEIGQQISHSIELSNNTDGYIAFMTKTRLRHFCIEPNEGIVPPRSKCNVTLKMQAQVDELPNDYYKKKITMRSTKVDGALDAMDGVGDMFKGKDRNVVDKVNVMVVFEKPTLAEES